MSTPPRKLLSSMEMERQYGIDRSTLRYMAARFKITNYGNPGRALWDPTELRFYRTTLGEKPDGYMNTKEAALLLGIRRSRASELLKARFQPAVMRVNCGQEAFLWKREDVEVLKMERALGAIPGTVSKRGRPMYDDGEDEPLPGAMT